MGNYTLDTDLPSVHVTNDLLRDLENYIIRKASQITKEDEQKVRSRYEVLIVDSSGRETLNSFAQFKFSFYPNDTREIRIKSRAADMNWEVVMARDRAKLQIFLQQEGAREIVRGIHTEVKHLFKQYGNFNSLFHYWFIPVVAIPISMFFLLASHFTPQERLWFGFGPTILSGIYIPIGGIFKPYCVFPTRQNQMLQNCFKWFVAGLLGFLLFSVVGVYFRKSLLHF